jgi:hypothetical protein
MNAVVGRRQRRAVDEHGVRPAREPGADVRARRRLAAERRLPCLLPQRDDDVVRPRLDRGRPTTSSPSSHGSGTGTGDGAESPPAAARRERGDEERDERGRTHGRHPSQKRRGW